MRRAVCVHLLWLLEMGCGQSNTSVNDRKDSLAPLPVHSPAPGDTAVRNAAPPLPTDSSLATSALTPASDTIVVRDSINKIELTNNRAILKGRIHGINDVVTFNFTVSSGKTLVARINPTLNGANIRINQIRLPDGQADGPFGYSINFPLHGFGMYQLILAENKIAAAQWVGDYYLTIDIRP